MTGLEAGGLETFGNNLAVYYLGVKFHRYFRSVCEVANQEHVLFLRLEDMSKSDLRAWRQRLVSTWCVL